ncbi:MAG: hypothetical protein CSA62_03770 [Planctomycetota bacterium]|nr:MAG: hypothetical protein CSA62_03770 [Planctomycetota bacterium]
MNEKEPEAQVEVEAAAEAAQREARMAEQGARLDAVSATPALLAGCVLPGLVVLALFLYGPDSPEGGSRVLVGGLVGVGLGWGLAYLLALWVLRACRSKAKPTTFLQPVALGFLLKLFLLGLGTVLFAGPLAEFGKHEAFAICFAAASFGYQMAFQSLYGAARQRALR